LEAVVAGGYIQNRMLRTVEDDRHQVLRTPTTTIMILHTDTHSISRLTLVAPLRNYTVEQWTPFTAYFLASIESGAGITAESNIVK
jgi:hypothetical protein